MTFKPATWYPIAVVLTGINAVGAWFAARAAEPTHAAVHVVLVIGFGLWAQRLRPRPGGGEREPRLEMPAGVHAQFEALEAEMTRLRQELSETQERLDFVERLLAQGRETPRVGPQR
jgi:hypothetical protein